MRILSASCLLLCFVLGLPWSASAYTMLGEISSAGPYGHDYQLWIFESIDDKAWYTVDTFYSSSEWHLATITQQAEQDTITNLITDTGNHGEYWLGGFQNPSREPAPADGWQWVTNEAWAYTNWNAGEPNDYYGPGSEQYLAMWGSSSRWNDEGALGNITGFILERNAFAPVPEPATLMLLGTGLISLAGWSRKRKYWHRQTPSQGN